MEKDEKEIWNGEVKAVIPHIIWYNRKERENRGFEYS